MSPRPPGCTRSNARRLGLNRLYRRDIDRLKRWPKPRVSDMLTCFLALPPYLRGWTDAVCRFRPPGQNFTPIPIENVPLSSAVVVLRPSAMLAFSEKRSYSSKLQRTASS